MGSRIGGGDVSSFMGHDSKCKIGGTLNSGSSMYPPGVADVPEFLCVVVCSVSQYYYSRIRGRDAHSTAITEPDSDQTIGGETDGMARPAASSDVSILVRHDVHDQTSISQPQQWHTHCVWHVSDALGVGTYVRNRRHERPRIFLKWGVCRIMKWTSGSRWFKGANLSYSKFYVKIHPVSE